MATINQNPNQRTLDAIDLMFHRVATISPFNEVGSIFGKDVPQEMLPTNGQIQPVGWVKNSDASNGSATVTIDGNGITILNGKLFLADYGGDSVLGPAGFDGSWVQFIETGVYNGGFAAGTGTVLQAATIVGTASTPADYLASLADDIPYWICRDRTGTIGVYTFDDPTYGRNLTFERPTNGMGTALGGTQSMVQDAPVIAGRAYEYFVNFQTLLGLDAADFANLELQVHWRDKDHAAIGSNTSIATYNSTLASSAGGSWVEYLGVAPTDARYARIALKTTFANDTTGAGAMIQVFEVRVRPVTRVGRLEFPDGGVYGYPIASRMVPSGGGGISMEMADTPGGAAEVRVYGQSSGGKIVLSPALDAIYFGLGSDVALMRSGANTLRVGPNDNFYINNANDVTLTSGNHPLTIGVHSSLNIAMDGNEIMARNNGAASDLHINVDGGEVTIGAQVGGPSSRLTNYGRLRFPGVTSIGVTANYFGNSGGQYNDNFVIGLVPTAAFEIRGWYGQSSGTGAIVEGETHIVYNGSGSNTLTFVHNSASANNGNKIICPNNTNVVLPRNSALLMVYVGSPGSGFWRIVNY